VACELPKAQGSGGPRVVFFLSCLFTSRSVSLLNIITVSVVRFFFGDQNDDEEEKQDKGSVYILAY
jgi:hypothetical protein